MKYITLNPDTQAQLYRFIQESTKKREKRRALAILMSMERKCVAHIAQTLEMNPDTVYDWLNHFEAKGLGGLKERPMPGRPRIFQTKDAAAVTEVLKKSA